MNPLNPGDEVLLFSGVERSRLRGGAEPKVVTVTRVGRKNAYVEQYGREVPFNMETGEEVRSQNVGGLGSVIRTREAQAEIERRNELRLALDAHGIRSAAYGDYRQSTATLEKLLAVLDAEQSRG